MSQADVIAVLVSDIHLSHKAPIARSAETSWYDVMSRYLRQLRELATKYECPIVCAGDVFDKWNSPSELVNFAIKELPPMYAVPGQHDLPHHNLADIEKSSYWTLVEAKVITNLPHDCPVPVGKELTLYGVPWGCPIIRQTTVSPRVNLAVVHMYCHRQGSDFPGAPPEQEVSELARHLDSYDAMLFGDNHKGFLYRKRILNNGTFIRRKIDEKEYEPCVGLLTNDGQIRRVLLDCEADLFIDVAGGLAAMEEALDLSEFLGELNALGDNAMDFTSAIAHFLKKNKVPERVKSLIGKVMEGLN